MRAYFGECDLAPIMMPAWVANPVPDALSTYQEVRAELYLAPPPSEGATEAAWRGYYMERDVNELLKIGPSFLGEADYAVETTSLLTVRRHPVHARVCMRAAGRAAGKSPG